MENNNKIVKARKEYHCDLCFGKIAKGQKYVITEWRAPKKDCNDNQIGIEYFRFRGHLPEEKCHMNEECKKGNHKELSFIENHPDSPNYGDTFCWCEECGTDLLKYKNERKT